MNLKSSNIYEKMNQYSVAGLSLAVICNGKLDEATAFGTLEAEQLELLLQILSLILFYQQIHHYNARTNVIRSRNLAFRRRRK